jgi:hypothetical protein
MECWKFESDGFANESVLEIVLDRSNAGKLLPSWVQSLNKLNRVKSTDPTLWRDDDGNNNYLCFVMCVSIINWASVK